MSLMFLVPVAIAISNLTAPVPSVLQNEDNSAEVTEIYEEDPSNMYSLDEYSELWANGTPEVDQSIITENSVNPLTLSPVKTKTAQFIDGNGNAIGSITLQYQTEIQGGRPQFVYDRCYLGKPVAYNGWPCTYSNLSFSGDIIKVYATFTFGEFEKYGTATFRAS